MRIHRQLTLSVAIYFDYLTKAHPNLQPVHCSVHGEVVAALFDCNTALSNSDKFHLFHVDQRVKARNATLHFQKEEKKKNLTPNALSRRYTMLSQLDFNLFELETIKQQYANSVSLNIYYSIVERIELGVTSSLMTVFSC